jgi:MYXO-CTERM domain-containing protein
LKKAYLLVCLSFFLAPLATSLHAEDRDRDDKHHRSGAPEMPGVGLAAAAVIGIAGYLVLRRRHTSQN